ncbi:MAG: ATP-binding cassette domain-containing protein [Verrucomicrobiota bacterium]
MITIENLALTQGGFSLRDVSFSVEAGSYAVLMGRTGSGKTTLIEAICGLRKVSAGRILLAERDVTNEQPAGRNIGYVPQDAAIFSTMTVRENLAFALSVRRWPRERIDVRVSELSALLGIESLLDQPARRLSGGEAQRVALGRALAFHPSLLLLDEPLSALDDETRAEMIALLRSVREHTGVTTLHITHSHDDAERLANLIFFLRDGKITSEPQ